MELIYTTQTSGFDEKKAYRNPEYFERPETDVISVVIVGDWPSVKAAYESVELEDGGKVEVKVIEVKKKAKTGAPQTGATGPQGSGDDPTVGATGASGATGA